MMLSGTRDDDRSGHGTIFKHHMHRINSSQAADWCRPAGGYALTVYHSMTDEVEANAQASILHFFKANGLAPPTEKQEGASGEARPSTSARATSLPAPAQDTREEMRRKAAQAALARMSKDEPTVPSLLADVEENGEAERTAGPLPAAESAVIDLT
ncbi:hypothetical protein H632_c979p2 [Helicosporidium sp. ATCC 50920]|nr:hypothetical protein H632_c979p2 [Helicosporidium sp. ATCC 50920]|eukprot:KDD74934.1 hypothetical protein H632_c979p2 [Helicosporidium sp. ATCC 50920]